MAASTIAIIILIAALVLYAIPGISLASTTLAAMAALVIFGVTDLATVTAGFANKVLLLVVGLTVLGQSFVTTGLVDKIAVVINKLRLDRSKKVFVMAMLIIATILGVFLNGSIVVAIMLPIVDAVVLSSNGKIQRKDAYWVVGLGGTYGNNLLTISATSMLTAVSLLVEMGYEQMNVFTPLLINLPGMIAVIIFYAVIGIKLQDKWFDFPDVPITETAKSSTAKEKPVWKQWVAGITFIVTVALIAAGKDYGLISMVATVVVIFTGCISDKEAWRCVSWGTIIVVAGSIGISSAIRSSGAAEVICNFFISIAGPIANSTIGVCVVLFFVAAILSSFMSDNATVAIMLPIAASIAEGLGLSAVPIFIAVCSGTKTGIMTPICVTPMTQACAAGYRFKDFIRMGTILTVISWICTSVMLAIVY